MAPIRSQIHGIVSANDALLHLLVEIPVVEYADLVYGGQLAIAAFSQHLTSVHLVARPVSEQALRILAPLGAIW